MSLPTPIIPRFDNGLVAFNGNESYLPAIRNSCDGLWVPIAGPTGPKLVDISGNGRDLDFENFTASEGWIRSKGGSAVKFQPTSDRAIGNFIDLHPPLTIVWYGFNTTGSFGRKVIALENSAGTERYAIELSSSSAKLRALTHDGSTAVAQSTSTPYVTGIPAQCWIGIFRSGSIEVWMRGVKEGEVSTSKRASSIDKVTIGARIDGSQAEHQLLMAAVISRDISSQEAHALSEYPLGIVSRRKQFYLKKGASFADELSSSSSSSSTEQSLTSSSSSTFAEETSSSSSDSSSFLPNFTTLEGYKIFEFPIDWS